MMSNGGSQSTMLAARNGQKEEGLGTCAGRANRCRLALHVNWKTVLNDKGAGVDSIRSRAFSARLAHNPAAAGPRVQIPPPQPISPRASREAPRKTVAASAPAGKLRAVDHSRVAQW